MQDVKVLIIDDEVDVGTFFTRLLQKKGYHVTVSVSGAGAKNLIEEGVFNVALVDIKLPDADGLSLLQQIKSLQPNCEVIIMTGYSTTRTAVKAIQFGAYDYLEKPFEDIGEVEELIEKAASYGSGSRDNSLDDAEWAPIAERVGFQVGPSPAIRRMLTIAYKIARKNINVLIQGETGTGKEVLARFIHAASNRADRIFIPVNCGALPENLLESELFGHEKGAFTGAASMRRGIFELANRGTLFLDEIGEASLPIQVKLLRVLETGEFLRVGGEKSIKTDVRIIAATNIDLEQALKDKTLREDLYYRLDVVRLDMPPLRARRDDIPVLVEHFVKKIDPCMHVSIDTMQLLGAYPWPGNIRELANSISQAAALCDDKIILPEHLSSKFFPGERQANLNAPAAPDGYSHSHELTGACTLKSLGQVLGRCVGNGESWEAAETGELVNLLELVRKMEKSLIEKMKRQGLYPGAFPSLQQIEASAINDALSYYRGNITLAAKSLGIGRNTLYRKIKEYHLQYSQD